MKYTLPPPAEKAGYVRRNFDEIAGHYDLFNDLITLGFHRRWKKRLLRESGLEGQNALVLDLCCGSGDISLLFKKNLAPASTVYSLDFSRAMLERLEKRLEGVKGCPVEIIEGDATDLRRFQKDSLDAVSISFGLRNVTDRPRCMKEAFRTLRKGGRFLILDVGRVRPAFLRPVASLFFVKIVPLIGYVLQGGRHEMYDYLPASAGVFPAPEELKEEILRAGFSKVKIIHFFFGSAALLAAEK